MSNDTNSFVCLICGLNEARLIMVTEREAKMEWPYYNNPNKRKEIDSLLASAALLFANCGPNKTDRDEALRKERILLSEIAKIDDNFAEVCGYLP